jgi:predicted permease
LIAGLLFKQIVELFLVTLFAASSPCAASITQIAQVYDKDSEYASAYYFVATLLCIILTSNNFVPQNNKTTSYIES